MAKPASPYVDNSLQRKSISSILRGRRLAGEVRDLTVGRVASVGVLQRQTVEALPTQSITPAIAYTLSDEQLQAQITQLREQLAALAESDPIRTVVMANLGVLEQEVLDRIAPTGPTGDRALDEWLGLHTGDHLSSDLGWIASQWPVGGSLADLNAGFRADVQALLDFVAATAGAQFSIFSYARSAPKQHIMHVGQYIRKGWVGYSRYKFSGWPGVVAAGGRSALLAMPAHTRRQHLRAITNPEVLSVVWDTGSAASSLTDGSSVAAMYHIGINNPVANGGGTYSWPTGSTSTSLHGSGSAIDASPATLPNSVTIRQNQAQDWPALAVLQTAMGAANVTAVAATATEPVGYTITGLGNVARRDAFYDLFFRVRSAARAGFVDLQHFQQP